MILAAVAILLVATTARAQTAEEVIAKNLKAQGGRDALMNLKAVERKGKVSVDGTFGQMAGTIEDVSIPWKKARRSLDLEVFVQKEGYNGTVAWREGMAGLQELEGEEAAQIKQAIDLNPFVMAEKRGAKVEKVDDEKIDDDDCYVIQLTPKDRPPVKFYVDKKSDLISRMKLNQNHPQFGEMEVTVDSSAYEQFGPVKLATKTKATLGEAIQIETTYTETKVNGQVDEAVFDKPKEAGN
jgi:hypothetical protein